MKTKTKTNLFLTVCMLLLSVFALSSCDPLGDVQDITINSKEVNVAVGEKVKVDYFTYPLMTMHNSVSWTTDNSHICTVNRGYVKGVSAGTTTVHARCANGKTASVKVYVKSVK